MGGDGVVVPMGSGCFRGTLRFSRIVHTDEAVEAEPQVEVEAETEAEPAVEAEAEPVAEEPEEEKTSAE